MEKVGRVETGSGDLLAGDEFALFFFGLQAAFGAEGGAAVLAALVAGEALIKTILFEELGGG
jgi:hypothetical protein